MIKIQRVNFRQILNSDYVKIGGPRRGDRISKYNQLLRLEGIE